MEALRKLKESGRLELSILLAATSIFSFALSLARYYLTGSTLFLFLNWNLFLAFIPWMISTVILISPQLAKQKVISWCLLFTWVIFFPNSPYILTDLFHLRHSTAAPIWFDFVLILSFAWTGLMYGFVSLMDIENILFRKFSKLGRTALTTLLLFSGGFGIYLGRFLRWNSWDIIQDPAGLAYDIGDRFVNPMDHPRTWCVTILVGLLLNIMYRSMKLIRGDFQPGISQE